MLRRVRTGVEFSGLHVVFSYGGEGSGFKSDVGPSVHVKQEQAALRMFVTIKPPLIQFELPRPNLCVCLCLQKSSREKNKFRMSPQVNSTKLLSCSLSHPTSHSCFPLVEKNLFSVGICSVFGPLQKKGSFHFPLSHFVSFWQEQWASWSSTC